MQCQPTTSDLKKPVDSSKLQLEHSSTGKLKDSSKVLEPKVDTDDILDATFSIESLVENHQVSEESATAGSPHLHKRKIWKDKLSSSEVNTLTTRLLQIQDLVSTSKEKDLTPFWTSESEEISRRLWLPTKIDSVDSVLTSSTESSLNTLMGKSWFSIKKKHPHKKNSLMTSFQSSQFSLPDSMDSEVTPSKRKSLNKPLKTLKLRLFPTAEEKEHLNMMLDQYRWYYNSTVNVVHDYFGRKNLADKKKYSSYEIRDLLRKYEYTEERSGATVDSEPETCHSYITQGLVRVKSFT